MSATFDAVLVTVVPFTESIAAENMFATGSVAKRTDFGSFVPPLALIFSFATILDSWGTR